VTAVKRWPRELLRALQLRRLRETVERVLAGAAPLAARLRAAGIASAGAVGSLDDLAALRFTDKADLREHYPFGLLAVPRERLARIAQNILFLAQADHGRQDLEREGIDIRGELEAIAEYFEGIAQERNVTFRIDAGGKMVANAIMCRRAIGNVIVNAVRYAEAGTVVCLRGHTEERGACIVIGNRGPRIKREELARLFDRFYRGDAARSEFTESSGLGLSIVQAIMRLHGGSVSADCTPDGWIEFSLRFPRVGPLHEA